MLAGKLRHRVDLQRPVNAKDETGSLSQDYETYATVWARVEPLSGQERLEAAQVGGRTTHRVTIRYNENVDQRTRVVHKGRYLNVTSDMNKDERNCELVLSCQEVS